MKIRFPLYAKVLLWFVLNLIALGFALFVFFNAQVKLGLNWLIMGRAGDRIQSVSEIITTELNKTSDRDSRNEILKRFSNSYRVNFYLFEDNGRQFAGEAVELPRLVSNVLGDRRQPPPPQNAPPERTPDERRAPPPDNTPPARSYEKFMERVPDPDRYWVGIRVPVVGREGRPMPAVLIAVSDSMSGGGLFLDFKPWILTGLGVLFFSFVFWIPLVSSITRSISQMTQATAKIADGNFDVQIATCRHDEIGSLGQSINRMTSRLAGFVTGQKRFLGDIAHELCSPIVRMQMALGILEQHANENQKAYVEDLREEVQQMSELVNELLSFSRAGLREKEVKLQQMPLAEIARRAVAREASENVKIQIDIPEDLTALAEPDLLMRALANLVRNASRYAGSAGPIEISAQRDEQNVVLSISDSGPGVPADELQKIFDPFYRVEASRSRETGGIGLGLAIVKTCIEACQGSIAATNRQPSGLRVDVRLKS